MINHPRPFADMGDAPAANACAPSPFSGLDGAGVRIAVIDSGVHAAHDHIDEARLLPGVSISPDGSMLSGETATRDQLGHGTAVTAAIQEKAPRAEIAPVQVFRDGLRTSAAAIMTAIRWSVEQEVNLINLSLGSGNPAHREGFARVVRDAADAKIAIIAACEDAGAPYYPGALPDVIGAKVDWNCPRTQYCAGGHAGAPVFFASGYPRPIPGVPLQRNLTGVSFAVAQMTGFAALAREGLRNDTHAPSVSMVRNALHQNAVRRGTLS